MSDKLTLADLRKHESPIFRYSASVTLADLVEVIESEGGHIWQSVWFDESGGGYAIPRYEDTKPGRYLVLRLPDEEDDGRD